MTINLFPSIFGGTFGTVWPSVGAIVDTPNPEKAPKPGKPISRQNLGVMFGAGTGWSIFPGYARAPAGTWATYQVMSCHPTLALVYATVTNPIIAGKRNVKILGGDGTYQPRKKAPVAGDAVTESPEDKYADLLEATFQPLWSYLMNACCESLRYGNWLNEVIWNRRDGATVIERFKSFRPGQAIILRDQYNDFAGAKVGSNDLDPRYVFNCVNEPHIDPLFGISRHENCREEWWEKIQAKIMGAKLDQKATGIIPIVKGPNAAQTDSEGNSVAALTVAQRIADALSRGEPVYMPQYLMDDQSMMDASRGGIDASKFTAWDIDFFDAGDTGTHASSILEKLNYIDKELFMAWCRPAQEAMETNFGTKAQAGSHRDVGMLDSQLVHEQIVAQINAGPVRTMNIANLGADDANKYGFECAPLEDTSATLRDTIIQALLGGPEGAKTQANLDVRRMLKDAELPMVDEGEAQARMDEAEAKQQAEQRQQHEQALATIQAKGAPGANGKLAGRMNGE